MPILGDLYKKIGRSAAGPVCIVATYDRSSDRIVGLTASSFVTLSFDPPMVMFALSKAPIATPLSSRAKLLASACSIALSLP